VTLAARDHKLRPGVTVDAGPVGRMIAGPGNQLSLEPREHRRLGAARTGGAGLGCRAPSAPGIKLPPDLETDSARSGPAPQPPRPFRGLRIRTKSTASVSGRADHPSLLSPGTPSLRRPGPAPLYDDRHAAEQYDTDEQQRRAIADAEAPSWAGGARPQGPCSAAAAAAAAAAPGSPGPWPLARAGAHCAAGAAAATPPLRRRRRRRRRRARAVRLMESEDVEACSVWLSRRSPTSISLPSSLPWPRESEAPPLDRAQAPWTDNSLYPTPTSTRGFNHGLDRELAFVIS
jgi:hypothetical protein